MTRFLMVLTVGCLPPFSLTAQSVNVRIPQPPLHLAVPFPMELPPPSGFPLELHDSYRDLPVEGDRKSTRLNSSHGYISYAVFCLKKKNTHTQLHATDSLHHITTRPNCTAA